ncbi:multiprotein-bridging factor 1 family protein [Streptomyces sp. NPDC092359]|uniref:helix-turn-helix domain-containing protein n=1 Tax=Streptomyces sp. NPDC092359 TaxID=3366014 RepID=UPI0038095EC2
MGDTGIGVLLVRLRTARGWSQQRVADEYNALEGRSAKTGKEIGRYEREARVPVPYARKYLAQVFHVDVAVLDQAVAVSKGQREDTSAAEAEIVPSVLLPEGTLVRGDPLLRTRCGRPSSPGSLRSGTPTSSSWSSWRQTSAGSPVRTSVTR